MLNFSLSTSRYQEHLNSNSLIISFWKWVFAESCILVRIFVHIVCFCAFASRYRCKISMSFVAYSVSVLHDLWGQHSTSCVSLEIALCSAWLRYDRINQTFSAGILIWWCCVFLHQGYQGLNLNWEGTLGLWARLPKIKHKIYIKKWTALYICVCVCVCKLIDMHKWMGAFISVILESYNEIFRIG